MLLFYYVLQNENRKKTLVNAVLYYILQDYFHIKTNVIHAYPLARFHLGLLLNFAFSHWNFLSLSLTHSLIFCLLSVYVLWFIWIYSAYLKMFYTRVWPNCILNYRLLVSCRRFIDYVVLCFVSTFFFIYCSSKEVELIFLFYLKEKRNSKWNLKKYWKNHSLE